MAAQVARNCPETRSIALAYPYQSGENGRGTDPRKERRENPERQNSSGFDPTTPRLSLGLDQPGAKKSPPTPAIFLQRTKNQGTGAGRRSK
jgi:hypothetical protein